MKSKLIKKCASLMAVVLCMAAFSVTAFASDGGYYASDEKGDETPPDSIDTIVVGTETVTMPENQGGDPLTPEGNLTLIDDILQSNAYVSEETKLEDKQFITVQSKNGNYFYLVIDRSGDTENVYFLNLVDESDLMALLEDNATAIVPTCGCSEKCVVGSINTSCEICRTNMSECVGREAVVETPPAENPPADTEPSAPSQNNSAAMLLILLLVAGGGGAIYWFKFRGKKTQSKGDSDLDEYDFGQDDMDDEEPYDAESDEETQ